MILADALQLFDFLRKKRFRSKTRILFKEILRVELKTLEKDVVKKLPVKLI